MELTTIINHCYRFPGFVYERAKGLPKRKALRCGCGRGSARRQFAQGVINPAPATTTSTNDALSSFLSGACRPVRQGTQVSHPGLSNRGGSQAPAVGGQGQNRRALERFFALLGESLSAQIEFVCSDMGQPYPRVIREKCSPAIHILDRFHIVAKMNKHWTRCALPRPARWCSKGMNHY